MDSPRPDLPSYDWTSYDPVKAGVRAGAWQRGLVPVADLPEHVELPDSPFDVSAELVPLAHPRIRIMGAYFHEAWPYSVPGAWVRPDVKSRLEVALAELPAEFGLAIWDAWRDPRLQAVLHNTVYADDSLPPGFVAFPDPDPRRCPPHATGATVDLTLTFKHVPLSLGTLFDAFVPEAAAAALEPDGPVLERDLRRLLSGAMRAAGFVGHRQEWWHWEYGTRYWAAVTGGEVLFGRAELAGQSLPTLAAGAFPAERTGGRS